MRDLVGEAQVLQTVGAELNKRRIARASSRGMWRDQASAIARLFDALMSERLGTIAFELAGSVGRGMGRRRRRARRGGMDFLMRQVGSIAGGTTEMSRNVISERVLGMPREQTLDRGVAFRDVPRGRRSE